MAKKLKKNANSWLRKLPKFSDITGLNFGAEAVRSSGMNFFVIKYKHLYFFNNIVQIPKNMSEIVKNCMNSGSRLN